jgi:hypothetical protein
MSNEGPDAYYKKIKEGLYTRQRVLRKGFYTFKPFSSDAALTFMFLRRLVDHWLSYSWAYDKYRHNWLTAFDVNEEVIFAKRKVWEASSYETKYIDKWYGDVEEINHFYMCVSVENVFLLEYDIYADFINEEEHLDYLNTYRLVTKNEVKIVNGGDRACT